MLRWAGDGEGWGLCLYHCLIRHMSCRLCPSGTAIYTHACLKHNLIITKIIAQPESYLKYCETASKAFIAECRGMSMVMYFHPHQQQSDPS